MNSKKRLVLFALFLCVLLLFSGCQADEKETANSSVSMGSVVTVKTYGGNDEENAETNARVISEIERLDLLISKNKECAALYNANHSGASEKALDSELYSYIKQAADIFALSDGKTAVSSGALTEVWGIDTEDFRVPSEDGIKKALPLCRDDLIRFNDENNTVGVKDGQILNLGAVGKGIACDGAVKVIKASENINGAVISVGGSIATVGMHGGKDTWSVGVRNPFGGENDYFAVLSVGEAFISTSGSYEKTFEQDGRVYHHILDLTTGEPVENGLCSVTVTASSGLLSDALSTVCFALGEERSQDILKKFGAQAVFVYNDKTVSITDGLKTAFKITEADFHLV